MCYHCPDYMLHFRRNYFLLAIILFFIEVAIALFVRDVILRPYGGDVLVVIFLYCLLKAFFRISLRNAVLGVLFLCFVIEGLQLFKLPERMGMEENMLFSTVLGSHFEWLDLLMYILGALLILFAEMVFKKDQKRS